MDSDTIETGAPMGIDVAARLASFDRDLPIEFVPGMRQQLGILASHAEAVRRALRSLEDERR